jgi:hypothetical protein
MKVDVTKLKSGFKLDSGLTHITKRKNILNIWHFGNMGNSIEHSVNPNLERINFPTIDELKSDFEVRTEVGTPDYAWSIEFDLTSK